MGPAPMSTKGPDIAGKRGPDPERESHPAALFLSFFSGSRLLATTGSTISPQFRHLQA